MLNHSNGPSQSENENSLNEVVPPTQENERASSDQVVVLSAHYEAILDWIEQNPSKVLFECATALNVSPRWLSLIIRSDSFRQIAKERKDARNVASPTLASVDDKLETLTSMTVDQLSSRVEEKGRFLDIDDLLSIGKFSAKALADRRSPGGVVINNNNNTLVVDSTDLSRARERMRSIGHTRPTRLIEATPEEADG